MLVVRTGDIFKSEAEALVNTVNCEGFMGKGLAYQFKKKYPETNKSYVNACKNNELFPSKLHVNEEGGKLIINFPTKNKWREKSKIDYIHHGMQSLVRLIDNKKISSIAIPPLGSGNGGLLWSDVKKIIMEHVSPIKNDLDIYIYEPSSSRMSNKMNLTASHFMLMSIKKHLTRFSKFRMEKSVFFMNIFGKSNYLKFNLNERGVHSIFIDKLSKDIKNFQKYHNLNTDKSLEFSKQILINKNIENEIISSEESIKKSTDFVNSFSSNKKIELLAIICYILLSGKQVSDIEIQTEIRIYFKGDFFPLSEISSCLKELVKINLLSKDMFNAYKLIV